MVKCYACYANRFRLNSCLADFFFSLLFFRFRLGVTFRDQCCQASVGLGLRQNQGQVSLVLGQCQLSIRLSIGQVRAMFGLGQCQLNIGQLRVRAMVRVRWQIYLLVRFVSFLGSLLLLSSLWQNRHCLLILVSCKRRSSVNSGAWLWRFEYVTGIEKSCITKRINRQTKEKYFIIANYYALRQTSNAWMFAMFKNFIHSQLLKPIFCP